MLTIPFVEDMPHGFIEATIELQAETEPKPVLVPKGWKLVPLEPTKHMLSECEDAGSISNHLRGARIYRAFLSAVPPTRQCLPLMLEKLFICTGAKAIQTLPPVTSYGLSNFAVKRCSKR